MSASSHSPLFDLNKINITPNSISQVKSAAEIWPGRSPPTACFNVAVPATESGLNGRKQYGSTPTECVNKCSCSITSIW